MCVLLVDSLIVGVMHWCIGHWFVLASHTLCDNLTLVAVGFKYVWSVWGTFWVHLGSPGYPRGLPRGSRNRYGEALGVPWDFSGGALRAQRGITGLPSTLLVSESLF